MWTFFEKRPFFRADMAGLGKYHTGRYGRIGVCRVNVGSWPVIMKSVADSVLESADSNANPAKVGVWVRAFSFPTSTESVIESVNSAEIG